MKESLAFVEHLLRTAHVGSRGGFSNVTETALLGARQAIRTSRSQSSFLFILNRWLTSFGDAHTVVRWREQDHAKLKHLDLPLAWNEHGLFFTEATADFRAGDRLVRLGRLDVPSLLKRFRLVIPSENDYYLRSQAALLLQREDALNWLNIAHPDDSYEVVAADSAGNHRSARLKLTTDHRFGILRNNVSYRIWPEHSLAIFRFERFTYDEEMASSLETFFRLVEEQDIRKVAVDIRNNPGGDAAVAFAILEHFDDIHYKAFAVDIRVSAELAQRSPHFSIAAMNPVLQQFGLPSIADDAAHYRLDQAVIKPLMLSRLGIIRPTEMLKLAQREFYLLTNGLTFSSGNLFAILVRDNHLGKLVGEPTGNRVNFNGSELRFDVPHTRFYLNISTAQLLRPDRSLPDAPTIRPDVYLPLTPEAARQGSDPVLDYLESL